jgi:hypothetical protein
MRRSSRRSTASAVVALLLSAALVGACNDDAPKLKSEDPPEDIVSYGIDTLGPEKAVLPPAQSRQLVILSMASQGVTAPEAECVLTTGLPFVGGEAGFAALTISDVVDFKKTAKKKTTTDAEKAALDACVSAESAARGKANQLSPDMDLEAARTIGAAGAVLNAEAMGLDATQAECYAEKAFRQVDLETIRGLLDGSLGRDDRDPGKAIIACLPEERIGVLAKEFEDELLRIRAEQNAEQQRVQEEINRQIAATTTTAGG